jgi:hypothetical protein
MNRKNFQLNLKKPRWMTGAIAGSGVFLLAMGILIASRQPEPETMPADAEPVLAAEAVTPEPEAPPKKARTRKAPKPVEKKTAAKPAAIETTAAASEAPALRLASEEEARVEATAEAAAVYTTVTGCLEQDDDQFRLKDADGENVPKSRSWKSGFLKKGSAKVDVVDPSNRLRLQNHVGQRVSVTGTLLDRELQARSVQRVSASCDR